MNIFLKTLLTLCVLMVITTSAPLLAATPEESFRKNFPSVPLDSITPTDIPGVYEIIASGSIAYYVPGPEYLIVGEILTKDRQSLTQARHAELQMKAFKDVPLDKALKIGSGPHKVIEITDPDCSFCRKASAYLTARTDVTRYVFLYALAIHPKAEAKIKYVFCAKDRAKAYEEAMTGKLDEMKFQTCDNPGTSELIKTHKDVSEKVGVTHTGTPLFQIDGKVVRGANMPEIEKILGAKK